MRMWVRSERGASVRGKLGQSEANLFARRKPTLKFFQWNWPGTFRANPKREKEGMMRCSASSQQMMSVSSQMSLPPRQASGSVFVYAFLLILACFFFSCFSCWLCHCYVSWLAFLFLLGQVRSG